jgi:hypothetical protein
LLLSLLVVALLLTLLFPTLLPFLAVLLLLLALLFVPLLPFLTASLLFLTALFRTLLPLLAAALAPLDFAAAGPAGAAGGFVVPAGVAVAVVRVRPDFPDSALHRGRGGPEHWRLARAQQRRAYRQRQSYFF